MLGGSVHIYAKEDNETEELNGIQREKKARRLEKRGDDKTETSRDENKCVSAVRRNTFAVY